jgi:NDP-sugar pyrophosphorylase family protein
MSKRAIILAGGKGTRLYPYTITLPKPLVPLGEQPILEIIIRQLVRAGFNHITLAVNHQAEIIKAFFQDGKRWGVHIDYALEDTPLGTMGPLKRIVDLPEHFLIMNGDILTDLDYTAFYAAHISSGAPFTISSYSREQLVDYGVLDTLDGSLVNLREKPKLNCEVSMGIYMASRRILDFIPAEGAFGFDHLMHAMIRSEIPVRVACFSGHWLDIGRPDDYKAASDIFEKNQHVFLPQAV